MTQFTQAIMSFFETAFNEADIEAHNDDAGVEVYVDGNLWVLEETDEEKATLRFTCDNDPSISLTIPKPGFD